MNATRYTRKQSFCKNVNFGSVALEFEKYNKNCTYCFFNDMINMKNLNPYKIEMDEMSYKNTFIYHTGYVTIKLLSYVTSNSISPLYLIIDKINRHIEKSSGNKYLPLIPTGDSKDTLKKYEELFEKNQRFY